MHSIFLLINMFSVLPFFFCDKIASFVCFIPWFLLTSHILADYINLMESYCPN